jgi:predicted ATPase
MPKLKEIIIKGFKSIESAKLTFGKLNVVIGANGSGKSNLIGAFDLLERVVSRNLQQCVASAPDRFLHHGSKVTKELSLEIVSVRNKYSFNLRAERDTLVFSNEEAALLDGSFTSNYPVPLGKGHLESNLGITDDKRSKQVLKYVLDFAQNLVSYHFHDTSDSSPAKKIADLGDNRILRPDAANLPAFLYWVQERHPAQFRLIEEHIRLVAPFFDRFDLAPSKLNPNKIKLEWRQKGSEAYFDAYSLSDGTLRFICLAALLLQPSMPTLILLDEPELGLHPYAIRILAEMLEAAASKTQILLATQSVTLLDNFDVDNIIVAENDGIKTTFIKPDKGELKSWLEEYSLGELWEKNVLGGRP